MSFLDRVIFNAASGGTGDFVEASAVPGYQLMEQAGVIPGGTYTYAAQSADLSQWELGIGTAVLATPNLLLFFGPTTPSGSPIGPTTVDAPKGSLILCAIFPNDTGAQSFSSLVDSAGNVYTQAAAESPADPNYFGIWLWYCSNTTNDLPAGSTFTATGTDSYSIVALSVQNANGGLSSVDSEFNQGTSITLSLAAPSSPLAFAFAALDNDIGFSTYVEDAGFTTFANAQGLAYKYITTVTSYEPSWTPSQHVTGVFASFLATQLATLQRTTVLYNSSQTGTKQSGAGDKINFTSPPQVSPMLLAEEFSLLSPAGPNGAVQINANGVLGGSSAFLFQNGGPWVSALNPQVTGDSNDAQGFRVDVTYDKLVSNIGFTDENGLEVNLNYLHGQNQYNGGTNAKSTPIALAVTHNAVGAGEHFGITNTLNAYGMSDNFLFSGSLRYAVGPIAGDEGVGYSPAFFLGQLNNLVLAHVTSVARATLTTTITSNVTGSQNAQNIPVASTTGANPGDWIVFNQGLPSGNPNICAAQIISINSGAGTINCICPNNFSSGTTITPALVLGLDNLFQVGQDRVLVDLQGASYSTGTASQNGTGSSIGTGTTWTAGMVGGSATNIGAFSYDADTYTGVPFTSGYTIPLSGSSSLRSWYQINALASTTDIGLMTFSVAGDGAYHGNAPVSPASGNYIIRPAARILHVNPGGSNTVVCETSTATWTIGDQVECVICPYPDVHGWDFRLGQWTPGGVRRQALGLLNDGARMFSTAITIDSLGGTIGNAGSDKFGWQTGISISSSQTGLAFFAPPGEPTTAAIMIQYDFSTPIDNGGKIGWQQGQYIRPNTANSGLDISGLSVGTHGLLQFISEIANEDGVQAELAFGGYLGLFTGGSGAPPFIRLHGAGANPPNPPITDSTFDIAVFEPNSPVTGARALHFNVYDGFTSNKYIQFAVGAGNPNGWSPSTPGVGQGPTGTATSNTTNFASNSYVQTASVWDGSAAQPRHAQFVADVAQGVNNAHVTWYLCIDYAGSSYSRFFPNFAFGVRDDGLVTFGLNAVNSGIFQALSLDAITNLTAPRMATFPDASGAVGIINPSSTTPASSGATGSPGQIEYDGTYLYVCVATNTWVRSALVGGW